jgi:hypothetical protein
VSKKILNELKNDINDLREKVRSVERQTGISLFGVTLDLAAAIDSLNIIIRKSKKDGEG